ncbi:MAG: NAD(P)H-hydrate epimerase [Anaerolineae bacterium]
MPFPTADSPVPYVPTAQMIEVDRLMIDEYAIDLPRMMENAGRALAHLARERFLQGDPRGRRITVLSGSGGNGGGALGAARRLANYGAQVSVFTGRPLMDFTPVPAHQVRILQRQGVPITADIVPDDRPTPDLILDGVIGYSLKGPPVGRAADLIRWANTSAAPVLALDVPSGVDTTTGQAFDPAVRAAATLTLALPKEGLKAVPEYVGELYLADISVPPALYAEPSLNLDVGPLFAASDIIRIV